MTYIIYDLECTCWEKPPADKIQEIIEIGALKINDFGEVIDTFSAFIRPKVHHVLSDFCQRLTNISQIDINRADDFSTVINDFWDWADLADSDEYLLCSWGGFDKRAFAADCRLHDFDTDWLEPHLNMKDRYMRMKKLRQPVGLKKVVEREGFEFTGMHHRAISDAENLAKIFVKYLDSWQ